MDGVLRAGLRTPDLYTRAEGETEVGTEEVTRAVIEQIQG